MERSLFENEFIHCELNTSLAVLSHRWKKSPPSEEFKLNLLRVLDQFNIWKKPYPSLAWLADTTLLGELDEDVEHWLVGVWEDLLFVQAGLKIHAVILGKSIFADYPMEKFKLDAERKFNALDVHLGVFSHAREAFQWIRQLQQKSSN